MVAGAAERGFRLDFAGAKTNRRLFRPAASRPVTDGHESSPDRPQSGIIEKSGGYFCEKPRQNPNESLYTTSCGRRARCRVYIEGPWGQSEAVQGPVEEEGRVQEKRAEVRGQEKSDGWEPAMGGTAFALCERNYRGMMQRGT